MRPSVAHPVQGVKHNGPATQRPEQLESSAINRFRQQSARPGARRSPAAHLPRKTGHRYDTSGASKALRIITPAVATKRQQLGSRKKSAVLIFRLALDRRANCDKHTKGRDRHRKVSRSLILGITMACRSEKMTPGGGSSLKASSIQGVGEMASNDWQPVVRVGRPKFIAGVGNRIRVEVKTKGWLSRDWRSYFGTQVSQQRLDARYSSYPCWDEVQHIEGSCAQDDAEHYIEMIDAAIHYANTKLRSDALRQAIMQGAHHGRRLCAVRERQAALDELAKKLARPEFG